MFLGDAANQQYSTIDGLRFVYLMFLCRLVCLFSS